MGLLNYFMRKVLKSGYDDSIEEELDPIRSEYPLLVTSGYHNWSAGSVTKTSLLLVPSSRRLHLKHITVNNEADERQLVFFYDGPGTSVPVQGLHVNRSTTLILGERDLKGWVFQSAVHASLVTSLTRIRVGGLIRASA